MVTLEKIAHLALGSSFDPAGAGLYNAEAERPDCDKIAALGKGTRYDVCSSNAITDSLNNVVKSGICHSFTHDGRCISLFKTLYTNSCAHQCNYCTNSAACSDKSMKFSYAPEELARITLELYRTNHIEGLFLSSGSGPDEDSTMEKMVETARILRTRHDFKGYIHLKILPGASIENIREAMELSDRVSVNLEATSRSHMNEMSPTKDFQNDIIQRQRYVRDLMEKVPLPAGQTTQLVVGGAGESDQEIFQRILYEYREIGIKRAYYSAFSPIKGTPFESREKEPLWREHRLYQMDWLYRIYHFSPGEIGHAFDDLGFLSNSDPKVAIARDVLDLAVDPGSASYAELIRVPGIGPRSARRILIFRKHNRICRREDLANLGVRIKRADPFLKINGWREATLDQWVS